MSSKARKLGRGLDSLIRRSAEAESAANLEILEVSPREVRANRFQPRQQFDDTKLGELAESIRRHGMLQPLVVTRQMGGGFNLVAGERRLRAALKLALPTVPVVVGEYDSEKLLDLALIENIQRVDLNPIELAEAYHALRENNGWTQAQLAEHLGKKRSSIANTMRFLDLPKSIQGSLVAGEVTQGHAKLLLSLDDPTRQLKLHREILESKLTVRDLEDRLNPTASAEEEAADGAARSSGTRSGEGRGSARAKDPQVLDEEQTLANALSTRVEIRPGRGGRGRIVLEYYSNEDYGRLRTRLLGQSSKE